MGCLLVGQCRRTANVEGVTGSCPSTDLGVRRQPSALPLYQWQTRHLLPAVPSVCQIRWKADPIWRCKAWAHLSVFIYYYHPYRWCMDGEGMANSLSVEVRRKEAESEKI